MLNNIEVSDAVATQQLDALYDYREEVKEIRKTNEALGKEVTRLKGEVIRAKKQLEQTRKEKEALELEEYRRNRESKANQPTPGIHFGHILCLDVVGYSEMNGREKEITTAVFMDLVRHSIRYCEGYLINTVGDCVIAYFKEANAAIWCAFNLQNHLDHSEGLRTRAAIASGEIEFFKNPALDRMDARGESIDFANRLSGAEKVNPSQIVISEETASALGGFTNFKLKPQEIILKKGTASHPKGPAKCFLVEDPSPNLPRSLIGFGEE